MNKEELFPVAEEKYGENYKGHYLSIWQSYMDSIRKISERRSAENIRFLSMYGVIISLIGTIVSFKEKIDFKMPVIMIAILGIVIAIAHTFTIVAYSRINASKFDVVIEIEKNLPISPSAYEWKLLKNKINQRGGHYHSLVFIERFVPSVFFTLFSLIVIFMVLY